MALTDQAAGHRWVEQRSGRRLRVRPVAPGDVDGLVALYGTLSAEDRHLRFVSTGPALLAAHAALHPGIPVCVERRGGPPLPVSLVERAARLHRHADRA